MANAIVVIFSIEIALAFASLDCDKQISPKDPQQCCEMPNLYPQKIVEECTELYKENTLKELSGNLPGPKRGDVSRRKLILKIILIKIFSAFQTVFYQKSM